MEAAEYAPTRALENFPQSVALAMANPEATETREQKEKKERAAGKRRNERRDALPATVATMESVKAGRKRAPPRSKTPTGTLPTVIAPSGTGRDIKNSTALAPRKN